MLHQGDWLKFPPQPKLAGQVKKQAPNLHPCYTNPNKFSLLPSPKGEGQDEGIHITTYWDWY